MFYMKKIRIGDVFVILIILIIWAGVFGFRLFGIEEGSEVVVSVDGKESVYSLFEDRIVDIENNGIKLTLVIAKKSVYVKESDCPEKSCINMGKITASGEVIACVPSGVYVKITGEGESEYDLIVG